MTDPYSTLAEKYFQNNEHCTKQIDPLPKVVEKLETPIEEPEPEENELENITRHHNIEEQNNNEKTFCCDNESQNLQIGEVSSVSRGESPTCEDKESKDNREVSDPEEWKKVRIL